MPKKIQSYSEGALIKMFDLTRLVGNDAHVLMKKWLKTSTNLDETDKRLFDKTFGRFDGAIVRSIVDCTR